MRLFLLFTAALPFLPLTSGAEDLRPAERAALLEALKEAEYPPIRPEGKPATEANYWRNWRAWIRRVIISEAKTRIAAKPWGNEGADFMEKALDARYTLRWENSRSRALIPAARKLLAAGADDPAVLWLAAEIIGHGEESWDEPRRIMTKAREAFRAGKSNRLLGWLLYDQKADHLEGILKLRDDLRNEALLKGAAYLLESLKDRATWTELDAPFLISELQRELSGSLARENMDTLRPLFHPEGFPEWARETLAGMWEVEMGWRARGGGYADAVPVEGFEEFGDHLAKAAEHLTKAHRLAPQQPYAAWRMIAVTMAGEGSGTGTPREWFDRSINACLDWRPAWDALNWAERPRLGGDMARMLAQGFAAAETGRFDTDAPFYLVYALDKVQEELGAFDKCRDLYRYPEVAAALNAVMEGYFRQSQSQVEREHFAWWRALAGWLTDRHDLVRRALAETGSTPPPSLVRHRLSLFQVDVLQMRGEAALDAAGLLEQWDAVKKAWLDLDSARALALVQKIPASGEAAPLLERMKTILAGEVKLAAGEWLKLTADKELSTWQWMAGDWSADATGNLQLRGEGELGLIVHRAKIGPDFEVRGSFYCPVEKEDDFVPGLALAHQATARSYGYWVSPRFWRAEQGWQVSMDKKWFSTNLPKWKAPEIDLKKPVHWNARVRKGRFSFAIGDQPVCADVDLTSEGNLDGAFSAKPNGRIGFSVRYSPPGVSSLFAPMEVRRLR